MYKVVAEILNKANNKRVGFVLYDLDYNVERKESIFGTQTWIKSGQVTNMTFTKGGFRMTRGCGTVAELPKVYIEVPVQNSGKSFKNKRNCFYANNKVKTVSTERKFGGCKYKSKQGGLI